jgi:hypothetical protein
VAAPFCCYKRPLKEEEELLPFAFWAFAFWGSTLSFWLFGALLWAFWCGKLLEGKRIIEGKNC